MAIDKRARERWGDWLEEGDDDPVRAECSLCGRTTLCVDETYGTYRNGEYRLIPEMWCLRCLKKELEGVGRIAVIENGQTRIV